MSGREYRERLIEEVRRCPVLWDTSHDQHRDIDARDQCWHLISQRLGTNSEVLKREWKTLRDSLRQSLRNRSSSGKRWRYQARMTFLFPYMTKRKQRQIPRFRIKSDQDSSETQHTDQWNTPAASDNNTAGEGDGDVGAGAGGGAAGEGDELFWAAVSAAARRLPGPARRRLQQAALAALHQEQAALEAGGQLQPASPPALNNLSPPAHV